MRERNKQFWYLLQHFVHREKSQIGASEELGLHRHELVLIFFFVLTYPRTKGWDPFVLVGVVSFENTTEEKEFLHLHQEREREFPPRQKWGWRKF